MKLTSTWAMSRRLPLVIAIMFLSVPAAARAATDPSALAIAKLFYRRLK